MNCLVLGGNGAIGTAITDKFLASGHAVWTTTSKEESVKKNQIRITGRQDLDRSVIENLPVFDAVVWAQGVNHNDSVVNVQLARLSAVIEANVIFIAATMNLLVELDRISDGSRLCVISSIWQEIARPNKFSYSISKSAIEALVKSAAIDLADRQILVNAVLPGVLDTPMTRSVLSENQLQNVLGATGHGRLVTPEAIANIVQFLCSDQNTGITGQSIVVDLGFSNARTI